MTSKIAFAAAASALLFGSAAMAQTTDTTPATGTTGTTEMAPATGTMGTTGAGATTDLPNVQGDLTSTLTVTPATAPMVTQPTTTMRTVASGSTRTTTTVTVVPKAPMAPAPTTGAGEIQAGERG